MARMMNSEDIATASEISKMNCDKRRYRTPSPNRKARLVRHLDFLSSTQDYRHPSDETRYSEFPPKKSDEAPTYERFQPITGSSPVYYRMPKMRKGKELTSTTQNLSLTATEQFDKRRWLNFFNENMEGYLQCFASTSGTLRNSAILHLCEEIIPKYVVNPALEAALNYEKSRQILTILSCYKPCSIVMSRALQALNEITLCDPLTAQSARGIQTCEFHLRQTMKTEFLGSESLADQRERIRVYSHVLCFLVLHYSKGNFTTYPSSFDVRSFDSIYKLLQDMVKSKNDPELEVVIGFASQSLTVVRYPKGKFKRCCDNLGKSLKTLDDLSEKNSRKTKTDPVKELFSLADGHTSYGVTLFLLYFALKTKYHHGNAYVQYRILQTLQTLLRYKVNEMIGKRPWRSGSIREKKKDWVFLYCAACVLTRIANDTSLSRELRICSVVESEDVFSIAEFFNNPALKKVNGYIRGLHLISQLCHPLVYSDIDVISFHTGHMLLMKDGQFNSALLRDSINKNHLCNIHRNIGLDLSDVIHDGEHSFVYKGTIIGAKQSVAVKVSTTHSVEELNQNDTQSIRKLCNEIQILKDLQNRNILPMLAYWNSTPPIHYVTMFASHASLLRYLRTNRNRNISLSRQLLLGIAIDVARALQYLNEKLVVHRNVMARKVLLSNDNGEFQVLLAGFQLAVKVDEETREYTGRLDESIPVFWSAAESVVYQRYSMKSDVWMFSVLCYEILTYGCEPYQDYNQLTIEDIMFKIVHHRLRFKKPDGIHDDVFELMMQCMDNDPSKRPGFDVIIEKFRQISKRTDGESSTHPISSKTPIMKARRHSNNFTVTDDEYVYCTSNDEIEKKLISINIKKENESDVNNGNNMIPQPPPDLLIQSVQHQPGSENESIDHVICIDEPLCCTWQSVKADDIPTMHSQLIENPTDQSLNCLMEKIPEGRGSWYLSDVIPSLSCCTYITIPKGLIFGRQYMICEYPDEGDLASYVLSKQSSSVNQLKQFAIQITSGLYELHQNGFIHRDMRLSHCFVYRNQQGQVQVKLGRLSRLVKLSQECLTHFCKAESDSYRWSAPEVITSGAYSKSSDVYSLGCVLWELFLHHSAPKETPLLRLVPYCSVDDKKIIECHKQRKLPIRPPSCPEWLYDLISKCWSLSPQQRPDVATVLRNLSQENIMASCGEVHQRSRSASHHRRPLPDPPVGGSHGYRRPDPIYETIPADYKDDKDGWLDLTAARVLYNYDAKEDDELDVKAVDVIQIQEQRNRGWWKCEINGRSGLLPSNYLEIIGIDQAQCKTDSMRNDRMDVDGYLVPTGVDGYLLPKRDVFRPKLKATLPVTAMIKTTSSVELTNEISAVQQHSEGSTEQTERLNEDLSDQWYNGEKTTRPGHSTVEGTTVMASKSENPIEVPRSWICAQTDGNQENPYVLSCEPYYNVLPSRPMPLPGKLSPGKLTRSQSLKLRKENFFREERSMSYQECTEDSHYQVPKQFHVKGQSEVMSQTQHFTTDVAHTRQNSNENLSTADQMPQTSTPQTSTPQTPPKSTKCKEMQKECQILMKKFAPLPKPPENVRMESREKCPGCSTDFAKSIYKNFTPFYENLQYHQDQQNISQSVGKPSDNSIPTNEMSSPDGNHSNENVNEGITMTTADPDQTIQSQTNSTRDSENNSHFKTNTDGHLTSLRTQDHQNSSHLDVSYSKVKGQKSKDDISVSVKSKKAAFCRSLSFSSLPEAALSESSDSIGGNPDRCQVKGHKRRASFSSPIRAFGSSLSEKSSESKSVDKNSNVNPSSSKKLPFLKGGLLPSPSMLRRSFRRSFSRSSKKDN
ncbi:uncharacterized protein [Ptychodera flava]|uniref:uncharacterized protein isoform X2 n=1 Tax=Ptychodera flava TaxID=63121 RepID=UPI003969EFF2